MLIKGQPKNPWGCHTDLSGFSYYKILNSGILYIYERSKVVGWLLTGTSFAPSLPKQLFSWCSVRVRNLFGSNYRPTKSLQSAEALRVLYPYIFVEYIYETFFLSSI